MKRAFYSLAATGLLLAALSVVVLNRQYLRDYYIVQTTDPDNTVLILGDRLSLTNKADFLYEASLPKLLPANDFNESCGRIAREHSIVLGCYSKQLIYLYDVQDTRLNGVKEVTAAHELLHAVYERLPRKERSRLDTLLAQEETRITDIRIKGTITQYRTSEPKDVLNELHSIFGTEVAQLSPELESHYKKYFTDRQKIVAFSRQYESTFTAIEDQIKAYDSQLSNLRQQIEQLEASLERQQANIDQERRRLDALRSQKEIDEYNSAVPAYNNSIRQYNQGVETLRDTIAEYNNTVAKRNQLAATQNDLVKQLDSKYQKLE
jgi:chromosome segregation ATPase